MQTLTCPDCNAVMHRVETVTEATINVGINQLARHCTTMHVIPAIERMLIFTADSGMTVDELYASTVPTCPGCGLIDPPDSLFYVRKYGRTILCCSQRCLDLVTA